MNNTTTPQEAQEKATQEAQEKLPAKFEMVYSIDRKPLSIYEASNCPTCRKAHHLSDFKANFPIALRVYDYAILDFPLEDKKYIIINFIWQGTSHRAFTHYYEDIHNLLESYREQLKEGYGVLLTPYWRLTLG